MKTDEETLKESYQLIIQRIEEVMNSQDSLPPQYPRSKEDYLSKRMSDFLSFLDPKEAEEIALDFWRDIQTMESDAFGEKYGPSANWENRINVRVVKI